MNIIILVIIANTIANVVVMSCPCECYQQPINQLEGKNNNINQDMYYKEKMTLKILIIESS